MSTRTFSRWFIWHFLEKGPWYSLGLILGISLLLGCNRGVPESELGEIHYSLPKVPGADTPYPLPAPLTKKAKSTPQEEEAKPEGNHAEASAEPAAEATPLQVSPATSAAEPSADESTD